MFALGVLTDWHCPVKRFRHGGTSQHSIAGFALCSWYVVGVVAAVLVLTSNCECSSTVNDNTWLVGCFLFR
jgi:hypothetical protein